MDFWHEEISKGAAFLLTGGGLFKLWDMWRVSKNTDQARLDRRQSEIDIRIDKERADLAVKLEKVSSDWDKLRRKFAELDAENILTKADKTLLKAEVEHLREQLRQCQQCVQRIDESKRGES